MKIKVDKEGNELVLALVDCALKAGGLQNYKAVEKAMNAIELFEEDKVEDDTHAAIPPYEVDVPDEIVG